jgi:hypothetical protein
LPAANSKQAFSPFVFAAALFSLQPGVLPIDASLGWFCGSVVLFSFLVGFLLVVLLNRRWICEKVREYSKPKDKVLRRIPSLRWLVEQCEIQGSQEHKMADLPANSSSKSEVGLTTTCSASKNVSRVNTFASDMETLSEDSISN